MRTRKEIVKDSPIATTATTASAHASFLILEIFNKAFDDAIKEVEKE